MISKYEKIDDTGFGNIRVIQDTRNFCYGIDAILLSDFISKNEKSEKNKEKRKILVDFCTGMGIIPLVVSYKMDFMRIYGIELQEKVAELAKRNVKLNNFEDKIKIINSDIRDSIKFANNINEKIDVVSVNPPYFKINSNLLNSNDSKTIARHETTACLDDFIKNASDILENKGRFYIIHRPSRMASLIAAMKKYNLEPKKLRMISPYKGKEPNLVLIKGIKNGGEELKVVDTLYVYEKNTMKYSEEINYIYER